MHPICPMVGRWELEQAPTPMIINQLNGLINVCSDLSLIEGTNKMSDLTKNVQPLQDFDWELFENGTVANVSKEELDKAYDETLNKVADHQVVEGKIISIDKKEVVVNIGYKSDGIIPATEFRYNPDLKEGDVVEVYVESAEDKKGQLLLSHKKARLSKAWDLPARLTDRRSPHTRLRPVCG